LEALSLGAQPAEYLRSPDREEHGSWLATGIVKPITVAPELDRALDLIERRAATGVEFAVGHSGASYEQVLQAVDYGLRQATHTFNGMPGLHHRAPGIIGAILTDDRLYAQVIADRVHVHPAVINLLVRTSKALPARS